MLYKYVNWRRRHIRPNPFVPRLYIVGGTKLVVGARVQVLRSIPDDIQSFVSSRYAVNLHVLLKASRTKLEHWSVRIISFIPNCNQDKLC
jgi:hypothetical protein